MKRRAHGGAELTRILIRANPVPPGANAGWARLGRGRRILEDIVRQPVHDHPSEKRTRRPAGFAFAGVILVAMLAFVVLTSHWGTSFPGLSPHVLNTGAGATAVTVPAATAPAASAITRPPTPGVAGHTAFDGGSASANEALASLVRHARVVVRGEIVGVDSYVTLRVEEWLKGQDPVASLRLHLAGAISEDGSSFMLNSGSLSDVWLDRGVDRTGAAPLRAGDALTVLLEVDPTREDSIDAADVWVVDPAESLFLAESGVFRPAITTDGSRGIIFTSVGIRRLVEGASGLERGR